MRLVVAQIMTEMLFHVGKTWSGIKVSLFLVFLTGNRRSDKNISKGLNWSKSKLWDEQNKVIDYPDTRKLNLAYSYRGTVEASASEYLRM